MLDYSTRGIVTASFDDLQQIILNPDIFLKSNPHTYSISKISQNTYDIVFILKKIGITKRFVVNVSVTKILDQIIYQTNGKSKIFLKFIFQLKKIDNESTEISIETKMDPGLFGNIFGREEFKEFIDELINYRVSGKYDGEIEKEEEKSRIGKPTCPLCAFFDPKKLFCYAGFIHIKDMENPACKGEKFSPYSSK
ncbi:hypothetical protein ACNF42_04055 [Cuniculiplasma sp. SKW3]|uniref:hypothetical protein n=1 Tax=Cuniculiplasma sp. SKW3 TaxID=3400170 RepID=UPI003FD62F37